MSRDVNKNVLLSIMHRSLPNKNFGSADIQMRVTHGRAYDVHGGHRSFSATHSTRATPMDPVFSFFSSLFSHVLQGNLPTTLSTTTLSTSTVPLINYALVQTT
uniref:Uncharacterized protein n=1 Tax=Steinernema glaseri TaxID=37863 RepID=A0A1I8A0F7_9BILA